MYCFHTNNQTIEVERFMLIVSGSFQIKAMMEENESLTDMEKLKQQEFNLDVQEQQRLLLEGEQEVTRVNTTYLQMIKSRLLI